MAGMQLELVQIRRRASSAAAPTATVAAARAGPAACRLGEMLDNGQPRTKASRVTGECLKAMAIDELGEEGNS